MRRSHRVIKVENLGRKYGVFNAVSSLNFEVPKGQIVGLLGHNGAGKTTTLKMLTGFLEPTSGSVSINGLDVWENPHDIQSNLGYLPEVTPLYPDMSIIDYLDYVAKMRGLSGDEAISAIKEVIVSTDLSSKAMDPIRTLSKGYKQRVGVAQAILHKPKLLILDEPTSGLDPSQIVAMRDLIKNLAKKATVIISTHIMQEVEAICDRVIIILQGKIALDSKLEDLKKNNCIKLTLDKPKEEVDSLCKEFTEIVQINSLPSQGELYSYGVYLSQKSITNFAPKLAKSICSKGWNLYRMSTEQRTLETVFKEVNKQVIGDSLHV